MSETRPRIDIGYRVGILTVESRTEKRKNGYTVWSCRCECGGEIELDTRCLQRRTVTDCGCSTRVKPGMLDLTGMRFGKLTCLEISEEKDNSGSTQWLCRCDCGNTCLAAVPQLRAGYKKSCGCLSRPEIKDYIGMRFGRLTVTEYAGKQDGMHRWKCVCDCGKETVVGQTSLQNGRTRSCGCLATENFTEKMEFIDGTSVKKLEARLKRPPIQSNTSGYNGVYLNKRTGKWTAQITFKGKTYYLGSYNDIQAAVNARKRGEEMYDDFLNWYYNNSFENRKTDAREQVQVRHAE